MSQLTKRAITEAFLELLNEQPLEKITINEIVRRCGVNRNTFYYYYQDIYALVDEIFHNETEKITEGGQSFDTWQDCFLQATEFAMQNKKAIFHLYHSVSRERLEQYLNGVTRSVMTGFIRKEAEGLVVHEADLALIADFYTFALVGGVLEWLGSGMKIDAEESVRRMGVLFDGSIRAALIRSDARNAT